MDTRNKLQNYIPNLATFRQAFGQWLANKGPRLGAALAFYSALSVGPLLVIALAVSGILFAKDILSEHLLMEIGGLIGKDGAETISVILSHSQQPSEGIIATLMGVAVLLLGASGVFGEMQDAFNTIWRVPPRKNLPWYHVLTDRFTTFAMVLSTGFLLLISLVVTTALNAMTDYFASIFSALPYFLQTFNWTVSIVLSTLLFALIFKYIPDIKISWSHVMPGAIVTSLLFAFGKILIGLYLGHSAIRTTYGAAGSFVVFLVWIYYSAQILYFGAEITKITSEKDSENQILVS